MSNATRSIEPPQGANTLEVLCLRSDNCWHGDVCRHSYSEAKRDAALTCGKKIAARPSSGCFKELKCLKESSE